jgi:hypothetical protein
MIASDETAHSDVGVARLPLAQGLCKQFCCVGPVGVIDAVHGNNVRRSSRRFIEGDRDGGFEAGEPSMPTTIGAPLG